MLMPVVFFGHGSPMNAIENNEFTQKMHKLAEVIPMPKAILVISAHWMTKGTFVTGMKNPKTIHDFSGFPEELFEVQYPASGSPELAQLLKKLVTSTQINIDASQWGIDHGAWSVLLHLYPKANIPVVQLSLDLTQPDEYHFDLGAQLSSLRKEGVLILGSGNIVHNLRKIQWSPTAKPFDWGLEFDDWIKNKILHRDFAGLLKEYPQLEVGQLSVPTPEHFLPLLYILGASNTEDKVAFDIEGFQNASISMRSVRFG